MEQKRPAYDFYFSRRRKRAHFPPHIDANICPLCIFLPSFIGNINNICQDHGLVGCTVELHMCPKSRVYYIGRDKSSFNSTLSVFSEASASCLPFSHSTKKNNAFFQAIRSGRHSSQNLHFVFVLYRHPRSTPEPTRAV